ncbi:hypothetical protein B841_12921 (plasmid) [Corynebacterium maris DSM 45190]|uniref:CobQ/CobB/MinD/ParA nucleotide binding domain-containing protein n=1 Tax=Corynebacterium maris DSM 45190 TaxID=1224163 RepID=S5SXR5_9CORY|nr:ParA family protein [Corynebacterium maris]AGS36029.1 hypothetical protein B841_12921 [Corynebacterium maris DSM 45190]
MIIGVINAKGGVGKTTTAIYLGCAFAAEGKPVTVIDLDQQGSASRWADLAESADDPLPFPVEVSNVGRLDKTITRAGQNAVTILDTPPGDTRSIDAAIKVSDFVLIPTQTSLIEVDRVWETLPTVDHLPHGVLITSARLGTKSLDEAVAALEANDIGVFRSRIPIRESIRASFGATPTTDEGYGSVAREILEAIS